MKESIITGSGKNYLGNIQNGSKKHKAKLNQI